MIETGLSGLSLFALLIVLSIVSSLRIAASLPWREDSPSVLVFAFGIATAPFLLGMASIFALTFAAGQHRLLQLAMAGVLVSLPLLLKPRRPTSKGNPGELLEWGDWALLAVWLLLALIMLALAVLVPLSQNDALEYASAARVIYEHNSIGNYPVLDPQANSDGYFGPWTHPPLYVALIFLTDVMQGNADKPGLMRLISPWFALSGSLMVFALARPLGRKVALAAAIVFLSTPLFFLGAVSALLDALPISAFVLLLATIVMMGGGTKSRGTAIGLVLALGLWTHSLAIVFIPLAIVGIVLIHGVRNYRHWLAELAVAILIALLAGGAHYVRNVLLFGAPISDNPAVFALPSLAWDEYFIINRGLDSAVATLQYGVLKGWFALEAFGFSFWGMAIGAAACLLAIRTGLVRAALNGSRTLAAAPGLLLVLLGVLVTYYGGVVVSVLLGIDLMVKNERYLLSIQGLIAVLCAFGFFAATQGLSKFFGGKILANIAATLLAFVLAAQGALFFHYSLVKNGLSLGTVGQDFSTTLSQLPDYQLTDYLRNQTPADSVVFSLKPSDMYYAHRRQIGYLDPRLVPLYEADTVTDGAGVLGNLGIDYIHVPSYGLPPLYNSVLADILRDRRVTTLLVSNGGGQIYQLAASPAALAEDIDITPGAIQWGRQALFELGGRKRLSALESSELGVWEGNTSEATSPFGLFQRSLLTAVQTGAPDLAAGAIAATGASEIGIDLDVHGRGLMSLTAHLYRENGAMDAVPLGTFELSATYPAKHYARRLLLDDNTASVTIVLQQQGLSSLTVDSASVTLYRTDERDP
ncbi:ArnT family glycosyltransferase [Devosia lacusdianchii]|uniref:ArnT family glycosyltransferase n=1 Tax=Devosia lacusdianchii TaxID=2917991 RepID=UPI001F059B93|nr:hypothetical protein [Devosia sp. JXJ CY 41]